MPYYGKCREKQISTDVNNKNVSCESDYKMGKEYEYDVAKFTL